ncbi:MAG TPA: arsenate reductase (glutaredoxin) [Longimicrobiales bacterium]
MPGDRIIVYEKPTCSTCRRLTALLTEGGIDFERVDYTVDPLSREKLVELIGKMGISPRELLRRRHSAYTELGLDDPAVPDARLLDAMAAHPELVQRPIIERGDRAVLGRPPERVLEIL